MAVCLEAELDVAHQKPGSYPESEMFVTVRPPTMLHAARIFFITGGPAPFIVKFALISPLSLHQLVGIHPINSPSGFGAYNVGIPQHFSSPAPSHLAVHTTYKRGHERQNFDCACIIPHHLSFVRLSPASALWGFLLTTQSFDRIIRDWP